MHPRNSLSKFTNWTIFLPLNRGNFTQNRGNFSQNLCNFSQNLGNVTQNHVRTPRTLEIPQNFPLKDPKLGHISPQKCGNFTQNHKFFPPTSGFFPKTSGIFPNTSGIHPKTCRTPGTPEIPLQFSIPLQNWAIFDLKTGCQVSQEERNSRNSS